MAAAKKHTSLHEYMQNTGVLESSDEELIQKVKAAYWRNYHKHYKREKRSKEKEFIIALSTPELEIMEREATAHELSLSQFIKQSSMAYVQQHFLIPAKADIARLEQTLSLYYSGLDQLISKEGFDKQLLSNAIDAVIRTESLLKQLHLQPLHLETIIKETLNERPYYIHTLKKLVETYDHQE